MRGRVVSGVLALLAPLLVGPVVLHSAAAAHTTQTAQAAPVITVTPVITATFPRQVPTSASGRTVRVELVVTSSEPVGDATAHVSTDDGLVVTQPSQSLGTLGSTPVLASFDVAGAEPGFHPLLVSVTAPGATEGFVVIPYVWTTGSPLFTGTNGIYARTYAWAGTRVAPGQTTQTRAVQMLSIVSKQFAYVGLPAHGQPECVAEGNGCLPYAWDYRKPVLQVGTGIIGAPAKKGFFTDGLVPPDPQSGEVFGRHEFAAPVSFTGPRSTLTGTWKYSAPPASTGLTFQKLTLDRDGTYRLAFAKNGGRVKKLRGTFQLEKRGAITFRSERGKVVQLGTVATADRVTPGRWMLWLVLSGRKGTRPDGNLLEPVLR